MRNDELLSSHKLPDNPKGFLICPWTAVGEGVRAAESCPGIWRRVLSLLVFSAAGKHLWHPQGMYFSVRHYGTGFQASSTSWMPTSFEKLVLPVAAKFLKHWPWAILKIRPHLSSFCIVISFRKSLDWCDFSIVFNSFCQVLFVETCCPRHGALCLRTT